MTEVNNNYCVDCIFFRDHDQDTDTSDGVFRCYCHFGDYLGDPRLPFDDACPMWTEVSK